jgi:hypothetical protein
MQIEPMWESTAQGGHIEAHIGAEVEAACLPSAVAI